MLDKTAQQTGIGNRAIAGNAHFSNEQGKPTQKKVKRPF
jgi:hypothetical protein